MRAWGLVFLVLAGLAGCYHGTDALSCKIRCDDGCPDGMTCVGGLCTTGASCGGTTDTCGAVGQACCASDPACGANGTCLAGTCQTCVTDVALGRRHTCVLEHDGTVWCVGDDDRGQLGNGTFNVHAASPVQVQDDTGPIADAVAIGAGRLHTCAVRAGGSLWCWGADGHGQLGNNAYNDSDKAVQVQTTAGTPLTGVVQVTAGYDFTCARDASDALWCWGDDANGSLGDNGVTTRAQAAAVTVNGAPFTTATSLVTGHYHSCAIDTTNHAWCWGWNSNGEIGDGTTNTAYQPEMITEATAIAAGAFHTCAIRPDTSVACWGWGQHDWLGTGSHSSASTPQAVTIEVGGAPLVGATALAAAGVSCALMVDHRVLCWGINAHGQVGNGAGAPVPAPVTIGDGELGDVDRIYAGYADACAHRNDGSLVCWGRNSESELADGTNVNHGTPSPLAISCQ